MSRNFHGMGGIMFSGGENPGFGFNDKGLDT